MVKSANNHQKLIIFHKISKYFVSLPLHCHHCSSQHCFLLSFPVRIPLGYMFSCCSHNTELNLQMHSFGFFSVRLGGMSLTSRKWLFWPRPRDCQKNHLMTAAIARTVCHMKLQEWTPKLPKSETRLMSHLEKNPSVPISTLCTRQSEPKASREHNWTDVTRSFT